MLGLHVSYLVTYIDIDIQPKKLRLNSGPRTQRRRRAHITAERQPQSRKGGRRHALRVHPPSGTQLGCCVTILSPHRRQHPAANCETPAADHACVSLLSPHSRTAGLSRTPNNASSQPPPPPYAIWVRGALRHVQARRHRTRLMGHATQRAGRAQRADDRVRCRNGKRPST